MKPAKKRSKKGEAKPQEAPQNPLATIPDKVITDEPAATPHAASEVPVNQQSDTSKKGFLGLTSVEFCTLVISGTTLLCVIILSWVISGKLNQIGGAEQTDKMIAQVSRISAALEQSLQQNRAALDSSINASRLDQRAWVGVKSIQMFPMEAGKPLKMEIKISNSGKTFALDLRHIGMLHLSLTPLDDVAAADKASLANQPRQVPTLATISPNGESLIPCASIAPITEEMINSINAGKLHVYLVGEINYTDVFKQWHVTRFFQHYVPEEQKFMAGPTHNDAD